MTQAYPELGKGTARKLKGSGYGTGYDAGRRAELGGTSVSVAKRKALSTGTGDDQDDPQ